MKEKIDIDFKKVRTLGRANPNLIARIVMAVTFQTIEQGWGSQSYGTSIILPLLVLGGLALAGSIVAVSFASVSFAVFGVIACIAGQYQMRKNRNGIIEARTKLNTLLGELEDQIREVMVALNQVPELVNRKEISPEQGEKLKSIIYEKLMGLLEQIPYPNKDKATYAEKLQLLFGADSEEDLKDKILPKPKDNQAVDPVHQTKIISGLNTCLDQLKLNNKLPDEVKAASQTLITQKLRRVPEANVENKHITRLGYASTLLGGFSLGFGAAISVAVLATIATAAVMVTFPWIFIPLGVGLVVGGVALAVNLGIKKKMEQDKEQLDMANGKVEGIKNYVRHINQNVNQQTKTFQDVYREQKTNKDLTNQVAQHVENSQNVQKQIEVNQEKEITLKIEADNLQKLAETVKQQSVQLQERELSIDQKQRTVEEQTKLIMQRENEVTRQATQNEQKNQQLNEKQMLLNHQEEQNRKMQIALVSQEKINETESERLEKLRQELELVKQKLQAQQEEFESQKMQQETEQKQSIDVKFISKEMTHTFANEHSHTDDVAHTLEVTVASPHSVTPEHKVVSVVNVPVLNNEEKPK